MKRIAINGYGRIGRNVHRQLLEHYSDSVEVVGINASSTSEMRAYLLQFDSLHGRFQGSVVVKDDDGNTVRTYEVSSEAGWNDISWDGKDDNGEAVVDGDYSLEIAVSDSAGNDVSFTSYMTGAVESIRFENNLVLLSLAGQEFYASEIVEVGL